MKKTILKRILAFTMCICLTAVGLCTDGLGGFGTLTAEAASNGYDFTYEDLFFKAPAYLLRSDAAEHITTLCTNAQSDGIHEISETDTQTAVMLEAMADGSSWVFNSIFGITTSSKAEQMEDELVLELMEEYTNTKDSYLCKTEEIITQYQKQFAPSAEKISDCSKGRVTEKLKKVKEDLKDEDIDKIIDTYYSNTDKILKNLSTAMDLSEVLITLVALQDIELSLIDDLIAMQPKDSDLTAPLSRLRFDMTSNIGEYFLSHYLVDKVISYVGKKVSDGLWEVMDTGSLTLAMTTIVIDVIKWIYEIGRPSVSEIVQADLSYSYTKIMERIVSNLQMDFITEPQNRSEADIKRFETAYSFYLTTMRVSMKKIAKATSDRMADRLTTFTDLLGSGALTYEVYIQGCENALQSDINRGLFVMPQETAKESAEKGNIPMGTIVKYSARQAEPSTKDYHYYNVNGCQNPYALTDGLGIPNCTAYAWGRAWELAGNDWLKYGSYFHGNADTFWSVNQANKYFPSGQIPAVGALAVWSSGSAGHIAVVENTDEMWQDSNGKYYGYYISHSSYGGFSWGNDVGNNTRNFHYDKVEDASWESTYLGDLLGFIYIYSGQGYDDSVNFVIDEDGVLTKYNGWQSNVIIPDGVTAIGDNAFSGNTSMQTVVIPDSVTRIGGSAFARCTNLRYVAIPDSVVSIGGSAFFGCSSLASVTLPINNNFNIIERSTFKDCSLLKQITIPNSVTEIAEAAFCNCDSLEYFNIPDSVTSIGDDYGGISGLGGGGAFAECDNLKEVNLSANLEYLGTYTFNNCVLLNNIQIPKSLKRIGFYGNPFSGCVSLKNVTFEKGTVSIPAKLFRSCPGLENIILPDTITEIGAGAFKNCSNLSSIQMPDSVTSIGDDYGSSFFGSDGGAFEGDSNLTTIHLSTSLTFLGTNTFSGCLKLTEINIPKSLNTLGFYGNPFSNCDSLTKINYEEGTTKIINGLFSNCTGLTELNFPDSITEIGNNAFSNCVNLKTVTIPNSVESMGTEIFSGCTSLESAVLPNIRQNLPDGTFKNCTSLKTITLPDSLIAIRSEAFYNCDAIEKITIPKNVNTIENNAFYDCDKLASIDLPEAVEAVGNSTFEKCDVLTSVSLPDALTSLGAYAFKGCEALTDIRFGTGLTSIGTETFMDCASLQKVVLPYSIETIGSNAFKNDTVLTTIYLPERISSIDGTAFSYPQKLTIYGVEGSYAQSFAKEKGIAFQVADAKPSAVTLSRSEITLQKGNRNPDSQIRLFATIAPAEYMGSVEWSSSDEAVASVDKNGLVIAKGGGTATITCHAGDMSASAEVTVLVPAYDVSLGHSSLQLALNETYTLSPEIDPSDSTDTELTFESSDSSVVSVDENGVITAVGIGEATVTVKVKGTSLEDSCTVTVVDSDLPSPQPPQPSYKIGDADGDGKITTSDALAILKHLARLPQKEFIEEAANADGEGGITTQDALMILKYLAGLGSLPVQE